MKWFTNLLFFLFLSFFLSCQKEKIPAEENPKYRQYGVPFPDVPEPGNIVMYEINLRAFSQTGDLKGILPRLDSIAALGVNVLWLMPLHPIGQINSVNSPYSVRDYKAISPEYGSLNDLRALTDAAHARGMAVIMDWVANHTAWDHIWISNKDWYVRDAKGNIIHPPGTNWLDVAELNYDNADMQEAMIDAMLFWVYEANVDGFRCDHADGVPAHFWKKAWTRLRSIAGRKFILFAEGKRIDHFAAGFDLNFGWEFYESLKSVFNGGSVQQLLTAHGNEYRNTPAGKHWVRFTTNHDESAWNATPVRLFNGLQGALAASVVTLFTGGVPMIYNGQEVGTADNVPFFTKSPINWTQNPDMAATYNQLFRFYVGSDAARRGDNVHYPYSDVFCLQKEWNNEKMLVIVNVRNRNLTFNIPSGLKDSVWLDVRSGSEVILRESLSLQAYSWLLLKK